MAVTEKLIKDSGVAGDDKYNKIVKSLLKKKSARGKASQCLILYEI